MRTVLVYTLALVALATGLWIGWPRAAEDELESSPGSGSVPPVIVAQLAAAPFLDRLEALGTVRANESVEITSNRADLVREIHFEDGDVVAAGALLVQLHDQEEQAALEEALAELQRSEAEFDRVSELAERKISSGGDLDTARAALRAAQARVERLRAAIAEHRITAPFGGLLGFRRVSKGAFVENSTVITTLDDLARVRLDVTLPEVWLAAVSVGQEVVARSDAYPERSFVGEVRTIGSRLDPTTRSLVVRAELENPDLLLRPGMLMKVVLERGERPVLQVPEQALIQRGRVHYVMRVDADAVAGEETTAEQVAVEVGRRRPGYVEILDGLAAGDVVIVAGIVRVRAGGRVRIAERRGSDA